MSPAEQVFGIVDRITAARPFRLETVAALVGFTIVETRRSARAGFRYGQGNRNGGLIAAAEIRERLDPSPGRDGLVILDLGGGFCIGQRQVMRRYGDAPELAVPTPHQPADAPLYFVYRFDWGQISFGFARSGEECLVGVVLDATGA
jgi:hypothetical protein